MLECMAADRAFIAQKDAKILELEAQILALEGSIAELRIAKEPAQHRLDAFKYPVLTLPTEIIGEIFIRFLPPYPEPPPLTGILSPTCLTHICPAWRNIALSTPALWRAIHLDHAAVDDWLQAKETVTSLLPLWLERSSPYPLSIRVFDYDASTPLFTPLFRHQARWEHFEATCNHAGMFFMPALNSPMPLLRSLSLHFSTGNPAAVRSIFRDAPLLRTVSLDDGGSLSIALPWSQLTCLNLRCLYPEECLWIFRHASRLIHCTVDLWGGSQDSQEENEYAPGDIVLPWLETFVIRPSSDTDAGFLSHLVMPALLHLELPEVFLTWSKDDPTPYLKTFLSQSGCRLQELHIWYSSAPETVYRDAFPSIPLITIS
ncbi:F-box domain-containing protein [Favolaschia claudopus]|uniref:F-box domain-containing protein n=1 Tax=Favolaschia claudopus TaxID=2862362 RepID=A0AAV9Z6Q6_9AGAR